MPDIKKSFLIKTFLFLILLLIFFYGFFLYLKIHYAINGKVWRFPTLLYSRIIDLEPGSFCSKKKIIKILENSMYKKVNHVMLPGEYCIQNNNIEFIRRSFAFPDLRENEFHVKLFFNKNYLLKIQNVENNRNFSFFRLEPKLIAILKSPEGKQRLFIPRYKYPNILIQTLLSIEDRYFYTHDGINFSSIVRALLVNITAGKTIQGGSTLTQQLIKNVFLTNTRSIWRKLNEIYMAVILDCFYTKDRILELYLNEVYFGQDGDEQIRGFPLASLYYFGRPIDELNLEQYALLVGMVKGASLYNPWSNPDLALRRRNLVLLSLYNQGVIQENIYRKLSQRSLNICPKGYIISSYPHFIQLVQTEIQEKLAHSINNMSGIKVFTTLDIISQNAIEKAIAIEMPRLKQKNNLNDLEIAMIVVDKLSGKINALIGGSDPKFFGYNRALQARRSIGSLSKPITYLTALSNPKKYNLNTWISDYPISIRLKNGKYWTPKNDNYYFSGRIMLLDALVNSVNIPTVNISMDIGLHRLVAHWMHLGISKNKISPLPSISLGAINLTPFEVAQVFQVISSGGYKSKLFSIISIISDDRKILYQYIPQPKYIESIEASYLTLFGLQNVVSYGTAKSLGYLFKKFSLAGKTGTTNNLVDSWFVGIDGHKAVITWIGRDNNKSTKLYGSSGAMKIYEKYLEYYIPTPLILNKPKNIKIFYMNQNGQLYYKKNNEYQRCLPVWLLNN